jgi:uncharacterized protein
MAFVIWILWVNIFPNEFFSSLYKYGSIWLGGVTIAWLIAIVMLIISAIFNITYNHIGYFICFIMLLLGLNIWSLYASFSPKVTEYLVDIKTPHTWNGKKIVMISDTHYGNIYTREDARKLVETINTLSGEIVIIPGDFFDGPRIDFRSIADEFKKIKAPHGVVFANGNHEEYRNTDDILSSLEKSGIKILNNKKIEIDGMGFAGVTYHTTESSSWLSGALDSLGLKKGKPTILLKHKPTLIEKLSDYPIDLVVSGHTHRGQMFPFSIIPDIIYGRFVYGMNTLWSLTSITTSGVGTWWPPQRLGTRSEIVLIRLK